MSNPYAPPEDRPREIAPGDAPAGEGTTPRPPASTVRSPEGVPYERPRNAPPNPADLARLNRLVRATALLVLVTVVADLLSFPWFLVAGAAAVAAIVVGARALLLAVRTRQRPPRMVLVLLLFVCVLSLARPATALLTWNVESTYARCQAAAITVQAQNACVTDYRQALNDRVGQLTGRTTAP